MKIRYLAILNLFVAILGLPLVSTASADEYDGLSSVRSAKVVWDERESSPNAAASHLKVVHQAYKDLVAMKKDPAFVVVFIGPSVRLVSKSREGYSAGDRKALDEIAGTVSAMAKDGIKSEICLIAARNYDVDPASVLPEIRPVGNGWISLALYQARGYSLVPVY